GLQNARQGFEMQSWIEQRFGRKDVDLTDLARKLVAWRLTDNDRDEPLVAPGDFVEFPVHRSRLDGSLADEPDDSVTGSNVLGEFGLPLLSERKVPAVDGDPESPGLERIDQRIRDYAVLPRIGYEDAEAA